MRASLLLYNRRSVINLLTPNTIVLIYKVWTILLVYDRPSNQSLKPLCPYSVDLTPDMSLTEASNYSLDFYIQPLNRKAGFDFYVLCELFIYSKCYSKGLSWYTLRQEVRNILFGCTPVLGWRGVYVIQAEGIQQRDCLYKADISISPLFSKHNAFVVHLWSLIQVLLENPGFGSLSRSLHWFLTHFSLVCLVNNPSTLFQSILTLHLNIVTLAKNCKTYGNLRWF